MPERWGAFVHSYLRVYFDEHGKACYQAANAVGRMPADVPADVLDAIMTLRLRADELEAWMRAWSKQEGTEP